MNDARLLELVRQVYAAPGTSDGWASFLDSLRETFHGSTANLIRHDLDDRRGNIQVTSGADPEGVKRYLAYWSAFDPWTYSPKQAELGARPVMIGDELITHADLQRTGFYNDFSRHYDLVRMIGSAVETHSSAMSVLSVSRGERQPAFGGAEGRFLETLIPHIRQAIQLHQRLVASETAADSLAEVVGRLSMAMLFVKRARRSDVHERRRQPSARARRRTDRRAARASRRVGG